MLPFGQMTANSYTEPKFVLPQTFGIVTYLPMLPMLSFVKTCQGHQILRPPHSDSYPRSFRQHSREFEFWEAYSLIGGVSGMDSVNLVS